MTADADLIEDDDAYQPPDGWDLAGLFTALYPAYEASVPPCASDTSV